LLDLLDLFNPSISCLILPTVNLAGTRKIILLNRAENLSCRICFILQIIIARSCLNVFLARTSKISTFARVYFCFNDINYFSDFKKIFSNNKIILTNNTVYVVQNTVIKNTALSITSVIYIDLKTSHIISEV
jgi:hypothetical protein